MKADVVVIGAGFAGLGAALALAERGAKVVLCEALAYPGGCASTFTRGGARYETGATLFAGLGPGQFLRQIRDRYAPELRLDFPDPAVTLRAPGLELPIPVGRERLLAALCALPEAPQASLRAFFAEQGRVAEALWPLFQDPERLPPWSGSALWELLRQTPRYAELLRLMGRPLGAVLQRHGLQAWEPLRILLDASCQITVQTDCSQAEAPFAMAALDYLHQGAGHVHGGIGELAWAMARAVERQGGTLRFACRVRGLRQEAGQWVVDARGEPLYAPRVVVSALPQGLRAMLGEAPGALPRLDALAEAVAGGWSAAMLYLRLDPASVSRPEAHHLQLVQDPAAPFTEGNHLFCSISAADESRCADGSRTATVSTHVPLARYAAMTDPKRAAWMSQVQETMRQGLRQLAPELRVRHDMSASPRTWQRFTRRELGAVGGIPRIAGLHHYRGIWPSPVLPGLHLVGDSVFPGQSVLATALGGYKLGTCIVEPQIHEKAAS